MKQATNFFDSKIKVQQIGFAGRLSRPGFQLQNINFHSYKREVMMSLIPTRRVGLRFIGMAPLVMDEYMCDRW